MTQCGTGASACPCTGKTEELGSGDQAGGHGVVFDVVFGFGKFRSVADPTVPGLVFPEWLARAMQNLISFASGRAFEPASYFGERHHRRQQQVDMIGHQHPGVKVIESSLRCAIHKLVCHHLRYSLVCQPFWSRLLSIQLPIFNDKRMARCRIRLQQIFSFALRYRTPQSPVQEYGDSLCMQVRQVSSIVEQESTGGSACRTLYAAAIS